MKAVAAENEGRAGGQGRQFVCILPKGRFSSGEGPVPGLTTARTHRLGAETGQKNACRILQARDKQEERPATVAGQGPYGISRLTCA